MGEGRRDQKNGEYEIEQEDSHKRGERDESGRGRSGRGGGDKKQEETEHGTISPSHLSPLSLLPLNDSHLSPP